MTLCGWHKNITLSYRFALSCCDAFVGARFTGRFLKCYRPVNRAPTGEQGKFMSFGNNNTQQDNMMSEINVTPLVDVMLVLLVVFIVTAPLLAPQSLKINLPKTTAVSQEIKQKAVRMTIDAQGNVELDNKDATDELIAATLKLRAVDPQFQLQIEADKSVSYGRVAELMAIAQRNGVSKLSFVTIAGGAATK